MEIARYYELPATGNSLALSDRESVLDLSSPKLLAAYLAVNTKCLITATDIFEEDLAEWRMLLEKSRLCPENLIFQKADGRQLPYKDWTFDRVYSISVLEHIQNNGDTKAVKEFSRVLKPGGRLVITVPVKHTYAESYIDRRIYGQDPENGKLFWSRWYTPDTILKRLIKPSGLNLKRIEYCRERWPSISRWYGKLLPFSAPAGLLFPLVAKWGLLKTDSYTGGNNETNALAVLEKPFLKYLGRRQRKL